MIGRIQKVFPALFSKGPRPDSLWTGAGAGRRSREVPLWSVELGSGTGGAGNHREFKRTLSRKEKSLIGQTLYV